MYLADAVAASLPLTQEVAEWHVQFSEFGENI